MLYGTEEYTQGYTEYITGLTGGTLYNIHKQRKQWSPKAKASESKVSVKKETKERMVSVRQQGEGDLGKFSVEDFSSLIHKNIKKLDN